MEKFDCPNCGKSSYTADISQAQKCPHCVERCIVVTHEFVDLLKSYAPNNLKVVVNRRGKERRESETPVTLDRRSCDRRRDCVTPIGWLMVKHPPAAP